MPVTGRRRAGRTAGQPRLAPPFVVFGREQWSALRGSAPTALPEVELPALAGVNDPASLADVVEVFLPLVRLLHLHIAAARQLSGMVAEAFGGQRPAAVPFIIAVAGSVAVGKSTFARILRALLAQGPEQPRVDLVATDGFLHPTKTLEANGLMGRKGFPESYDLRRMLAFLEGVKAGAAGLRVPAYSHEAYDIVPGEFQEVDRPDVLIFEGLNVLQVSNSTAAVASDFFDFTIYLHADTALIERWYVDRFLTLQRTVFQREASFFHHYRDLSEAEARVVARDIWRRINLPNLLANIEPTRRRAQLILHKGRSHRVEEVWLRQN